MGIKPVKVALGVSGAVFLLCVGVWGDALRRAENSISEHERGLPEEIARVRAHRACVALLGTTPPPAEFEKDRGDRGNGVREYWGRHSSPARFEEDMLVELARTQSVTRECGCDGWAAHLRAEDTMLRAWKTALGSGGQDRSILRRRFEALEALYTARPSLEEFVASEKVLQKIDLLRILHRGADPRGFVKRPPCWRELFSWRILIAESLAHVEEVARETASLHHSSAGSGAETWEGLFTGDIHYGAEITYPWRDGAAFEAAELTLWSVARAATAVALFRLERGRGPGSLSELVPLYLREIPVTRPSGNRLDFRDGLVGAKDSKEAGSEPWFLSDR